MAKDQIEHAWERHDKKVALICRNCHKVWEPHQNKPRSYCHG